MASLVKTALCALACLALVAAAPRSQINVGKSQGDNSYVANGIANPLYAPGSPNPQVVTMYTPWLEMFVSLSGGADQEYLAIAANSNSTVLSYVFFIRPLEFLSSSLRASDFYLRCVELRLATARRSTPSLTGARSRPSARWRCASC